MAPLNARRIRHVSESLGLESLDRGPVGPEMAREFAGRQFSRFPAPPLVTPMLTVVLAVVLGMATVAFESLASGSLASSDGNARAVTALAATDEAGWGVMRRAVSVDELADAGGGTPPASVLVQDAAGQRYVAQVGEAWLLDVGASAAGAVDEANRRWLTWVAPLDSPGPWQLVQAAAEQPAAEQAAAQQPAAALQWHVLPSAANAAGEAKEASDAGDAAADAPVCRELRLGEQPVLRLMGQAFDDSSPALRDETYKVFHHLWLPGWSDPITKGSGGLFPHHRGLFLGWNRIRLTQQDRQAEIDTWHAKKAHQRLVATPVHEAGSVYGRQVIEIHWMNEAVQPAQPFVREWRELVVVLVGQQRLVQFSTRLESLVGDLVLAGDPQHAGFQFRASQHVAEISKDQTYYIRPDGVDRPGSFRNWPDHPQHVDLPFQAMSFVIDGRRLTCARLEHPANPGEARFSERDYGRFGSYFEHNLTADQPLELRYQLRVLPGETDVATLERWQQAFAAPAEAPWQLPTASSEDGSSEPPLEFPPALAHGLTAGQAANGDPLFAGRAGAWDAAIRERGWIHDDGDHYKLWYTGYDGQRSSIKRLGLATSPDGWQWTRVSDRPLLEEDWVEDMMVVQRAGRYWMFAEGRDDIAQALVSNDGRDWRVLGPLDIRTTNGQPIAAGPRGTPTVLATEDRWYLFYERRDAGIWLATAENPVEYFQQHGRLPAWVNLQDEAIIGLGQRDYDRTMIALNQVLPVESGYLALFHSSSDAEAPRRWVCSAAFSPDLHRWVKLPAPLTTWEQNRSSGQLVAGPDGWRFYTTHGRVEATCLPADAAQTAVLGASRPSVAGRQNAIQ